MLSQVISVEKADGDRNYRGISPYANYRLRPTNSVIEQLSWYTFLKLYETSNSRIAKSTDDDNDSAIKGKNKVYYRQHKDHPHYKTKCISLRKTPAVVKIVGPTIRPIERRTTIEKEEDFWKQMILMFVPHRNLSDLIVGKETWAQSYVRWKEVGKFSEDGVRFMQHHKDKWDTKFRAQEAAKDYRAKIQDLDEQALQERRCEKQHDKYRIDDKTRVEESSKQWDEEADVNSDDGSTTSYLSNDERQAEQIEPHLGQEDTFDDDESSKFEEDKPEMEAIQGIMTKIADSKPSISIPYFEKYS
jgi:hypothetical protein